MVAKLEYERACFENHPRIANMNLEDYRAGQKVSRYQYDSFEPSPIGHPWVIASPRVQVLAAEARGAIGELNAFSQLVPDIDFFIRMYVAKEATQSSRIEGTQTNIEDAFKDAEDIPSEGRDDWSEVLNYIDAINHAVRTLDQLPLSNRLLRDTHAILLRGVRGEGKNPGDFRQSQNWIGVSLRDAAFVPPHHGGVEDLMSDLEKFLHDESVQVPPLIKIAIAHYQFETIHPFLDGNGRLGRLMISLYLASEGLLAKPSLYLSDYFERNKTEYVDRLTAVREGDHMEEWLVFFLYGVRETARSAIDVFKRILALKERLEREVMPRFSARRQPNAQNLMRHLYGKPVVEITALAARLDVSFSTASSLVTDFVKHGILVEMTGQSRNRLFLFSEYVSYFRGDRP